MDWGSVDLSRRLIRYTLRFVEVEPILAGLKAMVPKNWRVKRDELLAILTPVAV